MWAGSGSSNQQVNKNLDKKLARQQGENWLKCDDDDVRIFCIFMTYFRDEPFLARWVRFMRKMCWSFLEGGTGTQLTSSSMDPGLLVCQTWIEMVQIVLTNIGPEKISPHKLLHQNQMMFSSQKTSQAARPEDGSRHNSCSGWGGKDGELGKWKFGS